MIQSRQEYKDFCKEDCKANLRIDKPSSLRMWANLWYKNESYMVVNYLKALRRYEYAINICRDKGIVGKLYYYYSKIKYHRMGVRYGIRINPNVVGPGLRIPHLGGGYYNWL